METNAVPLGLSLKHEFEETVIFEKLEGDTVLQVGSTPDVAVEIARTGRTITVCSSEVEYLNTLSTIARRENLPILFKDYNSNLSNINETYDTVICTPDYEYETRDWWPDINNLLRCVKDNGVLIWSYNVIDIERKILPDGYAVLDSWKYNILGYIDIDLDEEDNEHKVFTAFFDVEDTRHFWSYIQLLKLTTSTDAARSVIHIARKVQNEENNHSSEGELKATTEEKPPEDGHMVDVPVCC